MEVMANPNAAGPLFIAIGATIQTVRFLLDRGRAIQERRDLATKRSEHVAVDREIRRAQWDMTVWGIVAAGSWIVFADSL